MNSSLFLPRKLNFSSHLITLWILFLSIFCPTLSTPIEKPADTKFCDFETDSTDHSVSDLLRCTDHLFSNPLNPTEKQFSETLNRIFQREKSFSRFSGRQGYGFNEFPYDQRPGGFNYRPGRPILDPLGSGYGGFDGYRDPYNPSEHFSSGLSEALNSISQYDDLKCVPRLLCEIATGSNPGNGEYKASTLENFGKQTLIGLLSSYNLEAASPFLAFGKAALLGYTSRGDSSICYQEYVRCPRDPRDLVYYLNNHNGGFFRFFKDTRRTTAAVQGSNRVGLAIKEPAPPPGLSGPESDRTGTGELKFDNPEPYELQDEEERVLHSGSRGFSRIVFPDDDKTEFDKQREELSSMHRDSKSLQTVNQFFPQNEESLNSQRGFFPLNDYNEESYENTNVVFESGEDSREPDYSSNFRKGRYVDSDAVHGVVFPDQRDTKHTFDSGVSKIFPSN